MGAMVVRMIHLLAQAAPAPVPPPAVPTVGGLTLDNIFWFSVFAIFLITIFTGAAAAVVEG